MAILSFSYIRFSVNKDLKDKMAISQPLSHFCKKEDYFISSILKVEGNKVLSFFGLEALGLRYGHFVIF